MLAMTHLLSTGDTTKANEVIRTGLDRAGPARFLPVVGKSTSWFLLVLAVDDPLTLLRKTDISDFGSDIDDYYLLNAELHRNQGRLREARAYADSARADLERAQPLDALRHAMLGWALALQGRKSDAIHHGRTGVEMLPLSKDAMGAPALIWLQARTYALAGEPDSAVAQIKVLLSVPSLTSIPELRINPFWDPLRGNPEFERLLVQRN
jgi:hypothetical protein